MSFDWIVTRLAARDISKMDDDKQTGKLTVDSAEIGIFEEGNEVSLDGFLESTDG